MPTLSAVSLKTLLIATLSSLLGACQTLAPVPPVTVQVPIAVSCVTYVPSRPAKIIGGNTRDNLGNTYIYLEKLEKYSYSLEAIVVGCSNGDN